VARTWVPPRPSCSRRAWPPASGSTPAGSCAATAWPSRGVVAVAQPRRQRRPRRRAAQPLPHTPTPRRPQPQPQRPPPHPVAWHGHRRVLARAFGFLGPLEAAVPLALVPLGRGPPRLASRRAALAFAAIVAMQMANAFECHSARSSLWSIGPLSNRLLVGRWPSRRSPCSPSSACHPCVTRSVSRRLPRRSGSRAGGAVAADRWRGDAQGTHPPPSSPARGKAEGPHLTRSKRPAGTPWPGRSVGSEREIRPSLRESS
jgi:hypothetical protein